MSEPKETREQTPDDVQRLAPGVQPRRYQFESGQPVPGLSSWALVRILGDGGFGEVWLAKHVWDTDQKPRAVKFCTNPAARTRLVTHERNVVVRVMKYTGKHPNIVPLLECNLDGEIPWLMYEYVEGGTLRNLIHEWRDLSLPKRLGKAARVLHAIAGALAICHRLNPPLVHRDLKPGNILMAGFVPRITDFGIGGIATPHPTESQTPGLTTYHAQLPASLHRSGTENYAPPEQLSGGAPHPRDDVYALGIIAYQMVLADLSAGAGSDALLELRDRRIPRELADLITNSTASNPERRPKDAGEWETTLAAIIEQAKKQQEATKSSPPLPYEVVPDSVSQDQSVATAPMIEAEVVSAPVPPEAVLPSVDAQLDNAPAPEPIVEPDEPQSPTQGPSERTERRQPPRPRRPRPDSHEERDETRREKSTWPLWIGPGIGCVVFLGLLAAIVIATLPPGKRSEPTDPTVGLDDPTKQATNRAPKGNPGGNKGSPKGNPGPPPAKIDVFDLRPVAGTLSTITPPKDLGVVGPKRITLPGRADAVSVGGGGRYIVFHFPDGRLSVFDANTASIAKEVKSDVGSVTMAAGANVVVMSVPNNRGMFRVYSLPTLEKTRDFQSDGLFFGAKSLAMGASTNGPLLAVYPFGELVLMDVNSGKAVEGSSSKLTIPGNQIRASHDGTMFFAGDGPGSNKKFSILTESQRKWKVTSWDIAAAYPSADGKRIYGMDRIVTTSGDVLVTPGPGPVPRSWYVPAVTATGDYFLKVYSEQQPAPGGLKISLTSISIHKDKNVDKSVLPALSFSLGARDLILPPDSEPLDKHLFLIPEAQLLVVLTGDNELLVVYRLSL